MRDKVIDIGLRVVLVACAAASVYLFSLAIRTEIRDYRTSQASLQSGDVNQDGVVDSLDLSVLLSNWSDGKGPVKPTKTEFKLTPAAPASTKPMVSET